MYILWGLRSKFLGVYLMAKKRKAKYNRRRNFVAIPFTAEFVLGTLADDTVLFGNLLGSAFGEDIFVISIDGLWGQQNPTLTEGPIEFGFAHGDLSAAEIREALVAELTNPDDIVAREHARRPVRRVGQFNDSSSAGSVIQFNNGNIKRTPLRFSVGNGFQITTWVFNKSGAALTTGQTIHIAGTLFGRWQR